MFLHLIDRLVGLVSNPSVAPALFGLVGVVVGAGISAISSWKIGQRRECREIEREERQRKDKLKVAAALVEGEFKWAEVYLAVCFREWEVARDAGRELGSIVGISGGMFF